MVGEYSSPRNGLEKLDVGVYSDWHRRCGAVMAGRVVREGGRAWRVQLRRAGPADVVGGRIPDEKGV